MIYCSINNFERFSDFPGVEKAIAEIKKITPESYKAGRIVIDGDQVFLNLFEYDTKDVADSSLEAHRKYIDVMYVVDGEETVYVKDTARLEKITTDYVDGDDYLLAKTDSDVSAIKLFPGMLLVLFPEDAHAPGCVTTSSVHVKKIVGKVKL